MNEEDIIQRLSKFSPKWATRLTISKFEDLNERVSDISGFIYDIHSFSCCIVGESMNLGNRPIKQTEEYEAYRIVKETCRVCNYFGCVFSNILVPRLNEYLVTDNLRRVDFSLMGEWRRATKGRNFTNAEILEIKRKFFLKVLGRYVEHLEQTHGSKERLVSDKEFVAKTLEKLDEIWKPETV